MALLIGLNHPDLFGNDAAEDEEEDVFRSYVLERDEARTFSNSRNRLAIARAYKGEGKSALLRLCYGKIAGKDETLLAVRTTGNALSPDIDSDDLDAWVRAWKASILGLLAAEVGGQIGSAWDDDAISLVEEAEKTGFRRRNFITAVLDRIQVGITVGDGGATLPKRQVFGAPQPEGPVKRFMDGKGLLWLFVDDVDENFQNTDRYCAKVTAFFQAARSLVNTIPELRIRSAIRPNVWTILKMQHEALSKIEQYCHDLRWEESDIRALLARRVEGYLTRTAQWPEAQEHLPRGDEHREKALIAMVFEPSMEWGGRGKKRPPHVVLYTMSKHRPRWVIELSKAAALHAYDAGRTVIQKPDIIEEMEAFGHRRIQDTIAEFRAQCDEVGELIGAFSRESEEFSTDELVRVIQNRVLNHMTPKIAGTLGTAGVREIAAFLFEIGVIYGRRDYDDGSYAHVTFAERPTLLKSRTAFDLGLRWEIHPVFRQALEIRDASGTKITRAKLIERLTAGQVIESPPKKEPAAPTPRKTRRVVRKKRQD